MVFMKKFSLLCLFFALMAQAQVQRFIYDYRYVPDINKKDSIASDMMVLDISAKGSVYQSLNRIKMDSAMREQFRNFTPGSMQNRSVDMRNMRRNTVQYKVTKEYPSFKTYLNERVGRDSYKVLEDEKQNWTILAETQQIGEYKAQKATTKWGGRDWTAWFSTDLPFQDGPYKFSGLPGLIVKLEDATGTHVMTMVANQKIAAENIESEVAGRNGDRVRMGGQEIEISEAQYKKAYKTYLDDPSRFMRDMMSNRPGSPRATVRMTGPDGREMDTKEIAKRIDKQVKDAASRNNNRIEPTLYDLK